MTFRGISRAVVLALVLLAAPAPAPAAKPVMVHYMPWFQSKLYAPSGTWGNHWQKPNFNPDTISTNGLRNIASWYYPLIGPYDSADPTVLEYHVLLMKLGGVDGVIVDWYGPYANFDYGTLNTRTAALFGWVRKAGLKFAICYESTSSTNSTANAQGAMLNLQTNYFIDPAYLRLNGLPVVLAFGNPPAYFNTSAQWTTIFSVLSSSNQPAFFTEDNRISPAGQGAFSWIPVFGGNTITASALQSYLINFDQKALGWPAYIDGAFPRYHDIYGQAGGASNGYLDDADGSTFTNTLSRAMSGNASLVQIATWNDFGEGTIVEPNLQYGYRDLGLIQDLRRKYLDASFPYHTNDVALAARFYNLRTNYNNYPALSAELDRVFTNLCTGQLVTAQRQMSGIEAGIPVIYNFSTASNHIQFNIGGYLAAGAQVQMATDLAGSVSWQPVQTFPPGTALLTFSTNVTRSGSSYFRVQ